MHDKWARAVEFDAEILRARFEHDDFVLRESVEKVGVGGIEIEDHRMVACGLDSIDAGQQISDGSTGV